MAETVHEVSEMIFGSMQQFAIALDLAPASVERDVGLAWGKGMLWLAGEPLWSWDDEDGPISIEWTWIDLLEFLADSWMRIIVEESYPFRLTPTNPTKLRMVAEHRWESLSHKRQLEEDEILFRFECHHDLARGMRGIDLPSVFLMREGETLWVCSDTHQLHLPFRETIALLAACGDHLAAHMAQSDDPRAHEARKKWASRLDIEPVQVLSYRMGIPQTTLVELEARMGRRAKGVATSESLWELPANDNAANTELQAVARMALGSGGSLDMHAKILARIKEMPFVPTPELDMLAHEATALVDSLKEPFAQGYDAARWLRAKLGAPTGRIEPDHVLNQWRVQVIDVEMPSNRLDAIACWGPRHGPVVLLNAQGAHSHQARGARSTLAHEIGHLLLDRHGSLPLAEVLGGNAPEMPEKRARAFAAEFLLPQIVVEGTVQSCPNITDAVEQLRMEYFVSNHIVRYQVTNSAAWSSLNDEDRRYVENLTAPKSVGSDLDDE